MRLRNSILGGWIALGSFILGALGVFGAPPPPKTSRELWSLQPIVRPSLPALAPQDAAWVRNPIDAFVLSKLKAQGLRPSQEADRSTLLRRVTFDLIGLPPTPEEVDSFLNDRRPDAYERRVDELLESPRYGERWARHWLDVVHFGETHGYDKDKPRPNAWPYRDYVIRSLNADKPYSRFVQEQIAGDVLFPQTRDGIEALGFLAAGPWDFIGHEEVPETKIDGKIARHLDRDDMVANTIQTFNSLTIQCAQCHDHKFDPIPQADYYALQAVFSAIDRTNKKYDTDPQIAEQRTSLDSEQKTTEAARQAILNRIQARAGKPLQEIDAQITQAQKAAKDSPAFGYHSQIVSTNRWVKWVQVDLGQSLAVNKIVLHPCRDDFNGIGEGFGFPVRYRIEGSDDATFTTNVLQIADRSATDQPNPKIESVPFAVAKSNFAVRYVRVTATQLALRQNDYIFALAELEVLDSRGTNVALGRSVEALDSIEAPARWQKLNLTDGWYPGIQRVDSADLVTLRARRQELLDQSTEPQEKKDLEDAVTRLARVKASLDALPPQRVAYVGAVHTGSGPFTGTGAQGGKPRPVYLLQRGNVLQPGREVSPGALSAVTGLSAPYHCAPDAPEGQRRACLAKWLTDPLHPLTWRTLVNRVWLYHFGRGLVETPNDFGSMGVPPTHPELLDWLAVQFRDGGQSIKTLHRLMVTSATYRQSSQASEEDAERERWNQAQKIDSENRWLWRMSRRKLEAEAVRDSILSVSGVLDLTMGGPSFQDFVIEKPEHSPHYEYQLFNPEDPKSHRRSIYRFIVRSQQQPFMTSLDCADPSMQVGKRNESVSPLQALTLLNNALVLSMAKHFATKLESRCADVRDQVRQAYSEALGHRPSTETLETLTDYARHQGLANLCRLIFNLNEFSFVD